MLTTLAENVSILLPLVMSLGCIAFLRRLPILRRAPTRREMRRPQDDRSDS